MAIEGAKELASELAAIRKSGPKSIYLVFGTEPYLVRTAADFDATGGEQSIHVVGIRRQNFRELFTRTIEITRALEQGRELEPHSGIGRRGFDELPVVLDRLGDVVPDARIRGEHEVAVRRREPFAQLHRTRRCALRLRVEPELPVRERHP